MKKTRIFNIAGLLILFSLVLFKVDAKAADKRTTMLDVSSFTKAEEDANEGWSWDHSTKTLTLDSVDIEVADDYGICLPRESCTIIAKGYNEVKGEYAAISCLVGPSYPGNNVGKLTVKGGGTLSLTALTKGFQYEGDMLVQDLNLLFTGDWLFGFVPNLTIDNAYVNATGTDTYYTADYALIGADGRDGEAASLTLKNCYVEKGGAKIKHNKGCVFIGTAFDKGAKTIVINRGKTPAKVSKVSTKTITFTKNYTQLGIKWNVPKYASGTYTVWRSTRKGSGYKKIATVYRPYYKDTGRAFHKTYYYKIRAYTQGKSSSYSVSGYKAVTTGLAKVKNGVYLRSSYTDDLTWDKVYGAQGYKIYRATSKKGTYKLIKTIKKGSIISYKAKRPAKTKTYYYKIKALRRKGKKTYYSGYSTIDEDDYEPSSDIYDDVEIE